MAKKKRKLTRKQRAALARGRRLACKKLFKTKKGTRGGKRDRLERQVEELERENRKIVQRERLKERLREAKQTRRALRALRSLNKPLLGDKNAGFLLG